MSSTDYLKIAERKIFKEACEVLPKTISAPLSIIAVRDSVLFTWDFSNNCVLSLNIKAARSKEGDNVFHQVSDNILLAFNLLVLELCLNGFGPGKHNLNFTL